MVMVAIHPVMLKLDGFELAEILILLISALKSAETAKNLVL